MKTRFKWVLEVEVDEIWVADGFDPDADQFKDAILSAMLGHARFEEVQVRLISSPKKCMINKAQGFWVKEVV